MGGIIEISPKGFTLGVKSLKKKKQFIFFNLPLFGLDLVPRKEKR
jgi:hypothetical protein